MFQNYLYRIKSLEKENLKLRELIQNQLEQIQTLEKENFELRELEKEFVYFGEDDEDVMDEEKYRIMITEIQQTPVDPDFLAFSKMINSNTKSSILSS